MQIEINGNNVEINISKEEAIQLIQKIVATLPKSSHELSMYIESMNCVLENNGEYFPSKCTVNVVGN